MLIAATALVNDFTLVTYNTGDFGFIEQLKLGIKARKTDN